MNTDEHRLTKEMVAAIAVSLLMTGQVLAQPCWGYEVTAIIQAPECPPFGIPPTIGTAISEPLDGGLPNVVGYYQSCVIGPDKAFLWIGNEDRFITLPMPDGTTRSYALAISGSGIVGSYDNPELELGTTGFLYDFETDEFTSLGTLPGGNWSEAHAINSSGEIVGFWGDVVKGPFPQAFIWRDGEMSDINPDFGTFRSEANGITDKSIVTGWMGSSPQTDARAFIWDEGNVTQLPEIPGGITSEGEALNSYGDIAGRGRFFDPEINATVWRAFAFIDGEAINLGTLPGFQKSLATGINDDQIIVGFSQTISAQAFVWQDGKMTALNDVIPPGLGLDFSAARGINQASQITGRATGLDGIGAFVLTPVEPPLGDLDGSCQVGAADLLILLANWGPCDNCENCDADLNSDCVVGAADLLILLVNWG